MGAPQPWWLVVGLVVFGSGGIAATWVTTRSLRKVEGIKNTTESNRVAIDGLDRVAQRQETEIARKDRRIAELEARVAELEAKPKKGTR